MPAEVEQRHSHNVRAVPTGGLIAVHDGVLRAACAAPGAVHEGDPQLPGRAMERERLASRRPHQQARRRLSLKVRPSPQPTPNSPTLLFFLLHSKS